MPPKRTYSCNDYREEMRLLGLKKLLNEKNLSKTEKLSIEAEIIKQFFFLHIFYNLLVCVSRTTTTKAG